MMLFLMHLNIFVFVNFINVFAAITYDCNSNKSVILPLKKLAFFETNNYPKLLTQEEMDSCKIKFVLENKNYTNYKLFSLTMETGFTPGLIQLEGFPNISNSTSFELSNDYDLKYMAAKGFVLFDEWDNGCLLESISRDKPFMFTDDTEMLFIVSNYFFTDQNHFHRKNACKWQFSAPEGYGFKVVIYNLNLSASVKFIIKNSTDVLINEKSAKVVHPYYNNDQWIQISLSKGDLNVHDNELVATVSIVKKEFKITEESCFVGNDDDGIYWTNIDENYNGYNNNVHCTYNLLIFPNTEIFVEINLLLIEENADFLGYYDNNTFILPDYTNDIIFLPHYNNSIKQVLWEFLSDGNLPSTGFDITFSPQPCGCADSIISCGAEDFTLMNDTDYYCSNLHCKFILPFCSEEMLVIDLNFNENLTYGIFQITSNGFTIIYIDNYANSHFRAYLNSSNENIFEVTTFPIPIHKIMTFTVKPFKTPIVDHTIVLTSKSPIYLLDTSTFALVLVQISEELSSQALSTIIYSTDSPYGIFQVYNNETLTVALINCFDGYSSHICKIADQKYAVYVPPNQDAPGFPFIAIQLLQNNYGCVFKQNVFNLGAQSYMSIASIANSYEHCVIHLLVEQYFYSSATVWTTASQDNVEVYIGTNSTKLFFKLNSRTAKEFYKFYLFSRIYTFIIPKNSAIFLTISQELYGNFFPFDAITTQLPYPFSTILATPNYGNSKASYFLFTLTNDIITFVANEHPIKITVIDYFMLPSDNCSFHDQSKYYYVNKIGDSLTFVNQNITLQYSYAISQEVINGALFLIETMPSKNFS